MAVATDLDLVGAQVLPESNRVAASAWKAWNATWPKLLAIAIVIGAWQLVVWMHLKPEYLVPSPFTVLDRLFHEPGRMLTASLVTLRRGLQGFVIAMVIGTVVGIAVARVKILRAAIGSMITGLQTMPSVAWVPLAIILFKEGQGTVTFVVVIGAAPSIANGLIAGVDYTPPLLLKAGHMMGLRRLSLYRHLILPASLPAFVAGLKQGWAFAWRSLMAGELLVVIANQPSLGVLLSTNQDQADMVSATAIIIVILVIGILVDSGFSAADRALRRRWGLS